MKSLSVLAILVLTLQGYGQVSIESYPLELTVNKTTNIVFPFAVKSVDRGSRDLLVQKASGDDHVLQLKAGKPNFQTTTVSVITAEGKLYSFIARYALEPGVLNLSFQRDSAIISQKHFLHVHTRGEELTLSLRSIYIQERLLWFGFQLKNNSMIDFEPDHIRFFLQDRHKAKRTAQQQVDLIPLNRVSVESVAGNSQKEFVFAFKQFTIPKGMRMYCLISEPGGGRILTLGIKQSVLLRARVPQQ